MPEKISRWQKFKRFCKRNMTPLWAKRFSYQVISFLIAVAMVVTVAVYAFTKSYDSIKLKFVDGFTITAHTGAFDTPSNSLESLQAAIDNNVDGAEIDIRQRLDGTVVMGHDIITTNNDGVEITAAFELAKDSDIQLNLDIKDMKALPELYRLINEYGLQDRVYLTGVETFQTKNVVRDCPGIPYYVNYIPSRFHIFSEDYQEKILKMLEETGAIGINCNHTYASKTLSNLLHSHGYKLSVWTVDRQYEMKRALVNQPDNITTNNVTLLRQVINNWGK